MINVCLSFLEMFLAFRHISFLVDEFEYFLRLCFDYIEPREKSNGLIVILLSCLLIVVRSEVLFAYPIVTLCPLLQRLC